MARKTTMKRHSRKVRGGDAWQHAEAVYGASGSQSASQGNLIKMVAAQAGGKRRRHSGRSKKNRSRKNSWLW